MDNTRLISDLQEALRAEHAAIVQGLLHAYHIGEESTMHALEGLARQDMRHYKWIAELIVRLGGVPTLERDALNTDPAAPLVWLQQDLANVERAIARYSAGAAMPAPPEVTRLYSRLLDDEEAARRRLLGLVEKWRARPVGEPEAAEPDGDEFDRPAGDESPAPAEPTAREAQVRGFLEFAIRHEYAVILQYLQHGFLLEDQRASRELEDIAIDEMRHLGWLSEMLVERGGTPVWSADRLEMSEDPVEMLELDQARELEAEADYQQMTAAMQDEGIRRLFDRIGAHELHHAGTLGELIERLKTAREAQGTPSVPGCPFKAHHATVGSLLGEAQS